MTAWMNDEFTKIEAAEELEIAPLRRDGTLRNPVTIWVVRLGDDLYVRSAYGRTAAWFRGSQVRHEGRIRAGGVEKDAIFVDAAPNLNDQIDAAYRTKYRRYGARFVNLMVSPEARSATIKLVPRSASSHYLIIRRRNRGNHASGVLFRLAQLDERHYDRKGAVRETVKIIDKNASPPRARNIAGPSEPDVTKLASGKICMALLLGVVMSEMIIPGSDVGFNQTGTGTVAEAPLFTVINFTSPGCCFSFATSASACSLTSLVRFHSVFSSVLEKTIFEMLFIRSATSPVAEGQ